VAASYLPHSQGHLLLLFLTGHSHYKLMVTSDDTSSPSLHQLHHEEVNTLFRFLLCVSGLFENILSQGAFLYCFSRRWPWQIPPFSGGRDKEGVG